MRGRLDGDLQLARARRDEPREQPQQRRLAGAVRPGDEQEPAALDVEVERREHALGAEPLGEPAGADHRVRV